MERRHWPFPVSSPVRLTLARFSSALEVAGSNVGIQIRAAACCAAPRSDPGGTWRGARRWRQRVCSVNHYVSNLHSNCKTTPSKEPRTIYLINLAVLRAVYGNLLRCIHAFSKEGTLFTVSNKPRKRMRRTGRLKVSRNAHMNSSNLRFSAFSCSSFSVRCCHFWKVFHANRHISSLPALFLR